MEALGEREDADGDREDDRSLIAREPGAPGKHPEKRSGPDDTHQCQAAQPPPAFDELYNRKLPECHHRREDEPDHADRGLAHMRGVLCERRQELAHHRDAGADQDHVQKDIGDEYAVPRNVRIAARLAPLLAMARRRYELQYDDEDQERHGVQQEQKGEGARVGGARDCTRDKRAECEADIHRHALLGERGVAAPGWRQRAQQGGLARPERTCCNAHEEVQRERLPRLSNQRKECERDRGQHERTAQHDPGTEPIRQCAPDEPGPESRQRAGGDDEAGDAERDPPDVVQVDDQERPDDAVPEHVHEPARLQDPDVPRKLRIQAAKVGPHWSRLSGQGGYTGLARL